MLARFHAEVSRMIETWSGVLAEDPAYSPNLSLEHGNALALAWPPRRTYPVRATADAPTMHPKREDPSSGTVGAVRSDRATAKQANDGSTRHA
jgi:hypothetical protein